MLEDKIEKFPVLQFTENGKKEIVEPVVRESPLTIILNHQELVTLLCSPEDFKPLAIGFLQSEGLLRSKAEIKKVIVDGRRGVVRVETEGTTGEAPEENIFKRTITSGCGGGASFYRAADLAGQDKIVSPLEIAAAQVFNLMREFLHRSELFLTTGGVHSAALCTADGILLFKEDIGRHNAIDKVFGECLLNDIPTDDRIMITSGRISSEILFKVARRNIPIIISKAAPTSTGVKVAEDLGITLIGFVRGKRMNVYAHAWRVKS